MKNYQPAMSFGEDVAGPFYRDYVRGDEAACVAFLSELAGAGPALELAIGAGRIALPLAARGIRVDGIDISQAMVDQLRSKPGGEEMAVTIGDFPDVGVSGTYRLIYVVWNSFFNVLSQDEQVRAFENVAAHLDDGGSFVIEAGSPAFMYGLRNEQYVEAESIEMGEVRLDVLKHDPATQMLDENHVTLSSRGIHMNPVMQRYAWPAELDLMARIAGMRLKSRWDDWGVTPYSGKGGTVVSVWVR